jgi:glyoxylase-like metal-dependent hydrolase (beta-lactamase superfamily II)
MTTTLTSIDLNWTGRPRSIAALLLESGDSAVVIDPGPESTLEALRAGLQERGHDFQMLDSLLLTHIHLDHAGATGALVRANPNLKVYVHQFGSAHMVDPSRLLSSAGRLYGGDLKTLYGECTPVPQINLRPLTGGEQLRLGEAQLEVFYTPGHASHHVSYFHRESRTAFVGDTAGIRVQGDAFLLPATPPPDIDVGIWNESLNAIAARGPERMFLTHFGFIENPAQHIRLYKARLAEWTELTRNLLHRGMEATAAEKAFVDAISSEIKSTLPMNAADHYIFNGGLRLSWLGLMRYVRKQELQGNPNSAA